VRIEVRTLYAANPNGDRMFQQLKDDASSLLLGGFCVIAVGFLFFVLPWLLGAGKRAIGASAIAGIAAIGKLIQSFWDASEPGA
jgi:hypothetical protein